MWVETSTTPDERGWEEDESLGGATGKGFRGAGKGKTRAPAREGRGKRKKDKTENKWGRAVRGIRRRLLSRKNVKGRGPRRHPTWVVAKGERR